MSGERQSLGLPNRVDGIDVSEFQGIIDWQKVAAGGFRFAIVRASLGPSYIDVAAARHMAGARAAGLYVMVYGAAQPEKGSPRIQGRKLLDGMGDTYTRAFLDLETRSQLGGAQLVDFAEEFIDEVNAYGDLGCGFYSYPWYEAQLQPALQQSETLAGAPLWQAYFGGQQPWIPAWGDVPKVPLPWHAATFWQYSGGDPGYRVPGVPTSCDRDLFMGDEAALRRFLGFPAAAAVSGSTA